MNSKLTTKLHTDYPGIFPKNRKGHSLGFECDDGWYDHINALCGTIMLFCKDHGDNIPVASQVKEKYGSLRFYIWAASVEVFDIIERFELESQYICEICGERGKTEAKGGWYKTVCKSHLVSWQSKDTWV